MKNAQNNKKHKLWRFITINLILFSLVVVGMLFYNHYRLRVYEVHALVTDIKGDYGDTYYVGHEFFMFNGRKGLFGFRLQMGDSISKNSNEMFFDVFRKDPGGHWIFRQRVSK